MRSEIPLGGKTYTFPQGSQENITEVGTTLNERGSRYGDFRDNAAVSQRIQDAMRYDESAWCKLPPMHREALTAIAQKIARILNGDPNYADNWHDIQGYARLVEERLEKATNDEL